MSPSLQAEAVSLILNKVGQSVTSPLIRNILNKPKSSFNLEKIMNEEKILLGIDGNREKVVRVPRERCERRNF